MTSDAALMRSNSVAEPQAVIVRQLPLAVFACEIRLERRWLGIAFHDEEDKGEAGAVQGESSYMIPKTIAVPAHEWTSAGAGEGARAVRGGLMTGAPPPSGHDLAGPLRSVKRSWPRRKRRRVSRGLVSGTVRFSPPLASGRARTPWPRSMFWTPRPEPQGSGAVGRARGGGGGGRRSRAQAPPRETGVSVGWTASVADRHHHCHRRLASCFC